MADPPAHLVQRHHLVIPSLARNATSAAVLRCPGDRQAGPVTEEEIAAELDRIDFRLRPHDIVLVATGADRLWGTPEYFTNFRGMTREATSWFINRGVKVIGIDSFGFDAP